MTFEQLLTETLHSADDFAPSPDLFAKVQRSIGDDQAFRRRRLRVAAAAAISLVAMAAYVALTVDIVDGVAAMSFTALEILVTVVMVGLVIVMGPAIRRFGEMYEHSVFAGNPETGTQVLRLLDIAYYLIFGAFTLMTLMFEPPMELPFWDREFIDQLASQAVRLGGLLMLMGVLHVLLLISLPVVGLVHMANERRARLADGAVSTDPLAAKTDRGIGIAVWIAGAVVLLQLLGVVLALIGILGASG